MAEPGLEGESCTKYLRIRALHWAQCDQTLPLSMEVYSERQGISPLLGTFPQSHLICNFC
ncbi:UNVERIFIED_CONTAM: hypothetical protein FKN15_020021 [Acipenser sinensis]